MRATLLDRRTLLRGTAGAAIALPWLDVMGARAAEAPRRVVYFAQPLGSFGEHFFPLPPRSGLTLFDLAKPGAEPAFSFKTGKGPLDDPDFVPSPILQPLAPHRSRILVLEGIDNARGNHPGYQSMYTGWDGGGVSPDQVIAKHIGGATRFPSLQFGACVNDEVSNYSTVSWYDANKGAPPEVDAHAMFLRLFSDVRTDGKAALAVLAQKRSILDAALAQATTLKQRVGAGDRAKIDQYLESVRDVEARLAKGGALAGACSKPEPTAARANKSAWRDGGIQQLPAIVKAHVDLIAMALACDLTRVVTFQVGYEANNLILSFLGIKSRWHDLSHTGPHLGATEFSRLMPDFVKLNVFMASQFGVLVQRLADFGLLEDTLAVWTNSMQNAQVHDSHNCPIVLAGTMGGAFRTGRHLRVFDESGNGRAVNDLHLTIIRAMTGDREKTFGDPKLCKGPIRELLTGAV